MDSLSSRIIPVEKAKNWFVKYINCSLMTEEKSVSDYHAIHILLVEGFLFGNIIYQLLYLFDFVKFKNFIFS